MSKAADIPCLTLVFFTLCCFFTLVECNPRTVHTKFWDPPENSTCGSVAKDTFLNVAIATAVGHNDTLHYIITSYGIPSLLMLRTDNGANVSIDPNTFCNTSEMAGSIIVSGSHEVRAYALQFPRLLEYNDTNDKAVIPDDSPSEPVWRNHMMNEFTWGDGKNTSEVTKNRVVFSIDGGVHPGMVPGSLTMEFRIYDRSDRSTYEPHLQFSHNSFEFDLRLNDFNVSFPSSRFALEMMMFSNFSEKKDNPAGIKVSQSIDDEHSPGVFQLVDWTSGEHGNPDGIFMQWKPVVYTDSRRSFQGITKAKNYVVNTYDKNPYPHDSSLALAYFEDKEVKLSGTNVSFGLAKDHFFVNSNFSVWTTAVGFGAPPPDEMSLLIIIVISVGLGLPVLLIIFGGIGVCIKKHKARNASPYRG